MSAATVTRVAIVEAFGAEALHNEANRNIREIERDGGHVIGVSFAIAADVYTSAEPYNEVTSSMTYGVCILHTKPGDPT